MFKVYGVIPSRYGSSRFPGKPLHKLCGKPLIAWVYEAVKRAESLTDVIVATDDERIASVVKGCGGNAVMTPSDLPSGTDRIACAAGDFGDDDILVNIQGDEPLISPDLIDELVTNLLENPEREMATAVTPIRDIADLNDQSVVKVVLDRNARAMYFSRLPIPATRDGDPLLSSNLYMRHLGIYEYRGGFLRKFISERPCALEKAEKLEQLRALWMGATISVVRTKDEGIGVDTPEDAQRVEEILRARGLAKQGI
jgi:3-deoxy-manno-octulosonate cytidylyltransferase (CMP-KDO synthetase)